MTHFSVSPVCPDEAAGPEFWELDGHWGTMQILTGPAWPWGRQVGANGPTRRAGRWAQGWASACLAIKLRQEQSREGAGLT